MRKAIATGRITTPPDGTIDPMRAVSEWGAQTDPAKQRGLHARQMGTETAAGTARAAATKPVPQAAIRAVAATDLNLAVDAFLRLGGTGPSLAIRVIRAMPDRFANFGAGRFVVDTVLLNIRLADAPVLAAGDTVEIAGQVHEIQGTPTRDSDRLVWMSEARAL